jgi:tRNA-dihydrouridine synthase B
MLALGTVQLESPFVQAALSGYSDGPMRRLSRRYGCPYAINEVVLDKLVVLGGRAMRRSLAIAADDHPVGGQLMGSEPEQFAEAANILVETGYDVIDVNFGCPVKKVLGRCRGGYLLSAPDSAIHILRRVHDAVGGRVPVTVKMRRGMDDSAESERNFFRILDAAFEIGLSAVDCVRMLRETGVDGVSVARGAIGNPWIFREAAAMWAGRPLPEPPTIAEQREALERHYALMLEAYGPLRAAPLLRKFGVRYCELHPHAADVKKAFLAVRNDSDWHAMLDRWYDPAGAWPAVVRRARPEALIAAGASWDCAAG